MRRRVSVSRFLDVSAGVDREPDDDDDGDGDGDGDREEEDLEEADDEPRVYSSSLRRVESDEDIEAIVEGVRRRDRERERGGLSPSRHQMYFSDSDDGLDILRAQQGLPDAHDSPLFAVQVKRGKEKVLVFRIYAKIVDEENFVFRSAFCVPKSPGRVYIEARSQLDVLKFCKGLHFVYCSSIMTIPILERAALMMPVDIPIPMQQGDLVKVRNGLYRGDIGEIASFPRDDKKRVIVKIKSREPVPFELKRKRRRRDPYLMDRERLATFILRSQKDHEQLGAPILQFIDFKRNGFHLQGKNYTDDGYFLLNIRADRIEKTGMEGDAYTALVADETRHLPDHDMKKFFASILFSKVPPVNGAPGIGHLRTPQDRFILDGDPVRVIDGDLKGLQGFLAEKISVTRAIISLKKKTRGSKPPVIIEVDTRHLVRIFELGDHVEVKIGEHRGRVGFVVEVKEANLVVVDPKQVNLFIVPALFVQIYELPSSSTRTISEGEPDVGLGWSVVISQGKHGGKSGKVTLVEGNCVSLIEDGTNIELAVHRRNVRRIGEKPETAFITENASQVDRESPEDTKSCKADHFVEGFEGEIVYAWRGPHKGRIGRVVCVSGLFARVSVEAALHCQNILDIPADCLIARCGCVLAAGAVLPWRDEEKAGISTLFAHLEGRSKTPPPFTRSISNATEVPVPAFHDPQLEGMWLFDKRVAPHRKKYNLVVKIDYHRNTHVSGLREGRVLSETEPLCHPIPSSIPPSVPVRYSDDTHAGRVEHMYATALRTTSRLKDKGLHLVVKGAHIGTLVQHIKSDFTMARVYPVDQSRSESFYIEKHNLCVVESLTKD